MKGRDLIRIILILKKLSDQILKRDKIFLRLHDDGTQAVILKWLDQWFLTFFAPWTPKKSKKTSMDPQII